MRKNLYVDMDGTLAVWQKRTLEEVATKGYFRNIPAMTNVVAAIRKLIEEDIFNIYILSSVFRDNHSADDKKYWLKNNLPEVKDENIIFVPYGDKKADYVELDKDCYLMDDLSKNLHEWEAAGGTGIKIYNGINGTNGTWRGFSVHSSMMSDCLLRQVKGICM